MPPGLTPLPPGKGVRPAAEAPRVPHATPAHGAPSHRRVTGRRTPGSAREALARRAVPPALHPGLYDDHPYGVPTPITAARLGTPGATVLFVKGRSWKADVPK